MGVSLAELPVKHRPRTRGAASTGWAHGPRPARPVHRQVPPLLRQRGRLTCFGLFGLAFGALGFATLAYLAVLKLVFDEAIGGRPLLLLGALLFLTGVILVSFGLLGELLVRTWHESQGKPIYAVKERRADR